MRNRRATVLAVTVVGALAASSAPALAAPAGPGWELSASTYPTNLVKAVDEVQEVTATEATGTFTLTFEKATTGPIPVHATDAEVQAALVGLASIGAGNVVVAGETLGTYSVKFINALGNMRVGALEAVGAATTSVTTYGSASGTIGVDVFNIGAGASKGTITVTDELPKGVKAKEAGRLIAPGETNFGIVPIIEKGVWECTGNGGGPPPKVAGATVVTCTDSAVFQGGGGTPTFNPNEDNNPQPAVGIAVEAEDVASGEVKHGVNHATIVGGGALEPASTLDPVTISATPAQGGLTQADAWFSNADGTVDRQAGSHPYTATFIFNVATALNSENEAYLPGSEIRDLETQVPPGFVGDLHAIAQCTRPQLFGQACPPASMVGRLKVSTPALGIENQVFNMVPSPGVPAELGFNYADVPVYINFAVKTGGNYGIVAHVNNIPQRTAYQSILTLWGVPQDASHNRWRNREGGCTQKEIEEPLLTEPKVINYCAAQQAPVVVPFLRLPTSCGEPEQGLFVFRELHGWQEPGAKFLPIEFPPHDATDHAAAFTGCGLLGTEPALTTALDTARTDTPSGLTADVQPPLAGLEEAAGLSPADIQNTKVTLPEGLVINPGQAAGLQACPAGRPDGEHPFGDALTTPEEETKGNEDTGPSSCPSASKVGTVTIKSPLIEADTEKQFEGNVYVLQSNPPEIKLLVAASADGVNIKLVGDVHLNEQSGRIETTFQSTPQLPFSDLKLTFEGGTHAALATPTRCGAAFTEADFTSWSAPLSGDSLQKAGLSITEGANGSSCPAGQLPFAPTLTAGSTSDQAGAFTSFTTALQRGDGEQRIEKLQFTAPSGLAAMISSVAPCAEPQAQLGACPSSSRIGHAVVASGPGSNPLTLPQPGQEAPGIYLTGPYAGAPFGLSIVTPVVAGPFNLGTIITRAKIEIDPHTAQVTITTDPLPQIVKGVPTDLRRIDAVIDRPAFMFNPTNCTPQAFSGSAWGIPPPGGVEPSQTAQLSNHFQVGGCRGLEFHPKLSVSTSGKTSKANGASLTAKLTYPNTPQGSQANITRVKVDLPKQLPSRLTTLQKACTNTQFELNPANCPAGSKIGYATVTTPLLPVPLEGPAIFVSHGGEAFPSLTIVLQGYGVTIDLVGTTFISKKGITSTTFKTVPDVPFNTFILTLPQGKYSALAANGNLCKSKLAMPTEFLAQNGAKIKRSTKISVTGCAKHKAKRAKKKHGRHPAVCRGRSGGCGGGVLVAGVGQGAPVGAAVVRRG